MTTTSLVRAVVLPLTFAAGVLSGVLVSGAVRADAQPHVRNALEYLHLAMDSLEKADNDDNGHRAKAMEHVEKAVEETKACLEHEEEK